MTVLIVFLLACFVVGGSRRWGTWVIDRWWLFLAVSAVFAASFYSLRVVL